MSEKETENSLTPPGVSPVAELPPNTDKKVINIDELKPNSVIVIKISTEGMQQRIAATQQIATALRPLRDLIKAKNITFIVMGSNESLDDIDEEQMSAYGWVRKEESRIILPN